MKTQAAVLWGREQDWQIVEIDLDPPKDHEVLVRWVAAGLCHSDQHLRESDHQRQPEDRRPPAASDARLFPMVGGHEGEASWSRSARACTASGRATTWPPASSRSAAGARCASPGTPICATSERRPSPRARSPTGRSSLPLRRPAPQCDVQAGHLRRVRRRPRGVAGEGGAGPSPAARWPSSRAGSPPAGDRPSTGPRSSRVTPSSWSASVGWA